MVKAVCAGKKTRERRVQRLALLGPEEIENEGRGRGRLCEPSTVCPGSKKQSGTLCRPRPNRPSSSSSGMDGCWSKRFARKENAGTEGTAVGSAWSRRDRERRTRTRTRTIMRTVHGLPEDDARTAGPTGWLGLRPTVDQGHRTIKTRGESRRAIASVVRVEAVDQSGQHCYDTRKHFLPGANTIGRH